MDTLIKKTMQYFNFAPNVDALQARCVVAAGGATINRGAASTPITQSTPNAVNSLDMVLQNSNAWYQATRAVSVVCGVSRRRPALPVFSAILQMTP